MKLKINSQQYNPLLKRKEITFEVRHEETKGTPPRLEVRKELATLLKTDYETVYVKRLETKTGTMTAVGEANAYDSVEQAKLLEPEYIIARNAPPGKPEEKKEEKKEEAKEAKEPKKEKEAKKEEEEKEE